MEMDEVFYFWHELERKYPVDKWRINGMAVWPLIRLQLGANISVHLQNAVKPISKWRQYSDKILKVWEDGIRLALKDRRHQQKLARADVVFLGSICSRNVLMPDGTLLAHTLDPVNMWLKHEGYTTFCFEEMGRDLLRLPRWSNSYAIDNLILKCLFHKRLFKRSVRKADCYLERYDEFQKELSFRGVDIKTLKINELVAQVMFLDELADAFAEKLKIIKPYIVIHECWYSYSRMALALAAHRFNIPVVEVQHGVAAGSRRHQAYFDWSKIPDGGYALMPDYMWVWDEIDYKAMGPWAKESMRPFVGGHPMNLIWGDSESDLSKYYQTKFDEEYGHDKPTILMTLQWGVTYPQWIIDFINLHDEFNWLIRLHPIIDEHEKDFIDQLQDKRNIHKNSVVSFPLEILLKNVDIHITLYSSVVLDAEPFGCPSIVMHPLAKEMYTKQIAKNLVYYADDAENLQVMINDLLAKCDGGNTNHDKSKQHEYGYHAMKKIMYIMDNSKTCWE